MSWAWAFLDWLEVILDWLEAFLCGLEAIQHELEAHLFNMRGHYLQQLWLSLLVVIGAFLIIYALLAASKRRHARRNKPRK